MDPLHAWGYGFSSAPPRLLRLPTQRSARADTPPRKQKKSFPSSSSTTTTATSSMASYSSSLASSPFYLPSFGIRDRRRGSRVVSLRLPERPMPARLGPSLPEGSNAKRDSSASGSSSKHRHHHSKDKKSGDAAGGSQVMVTRTNQLKTKSTGDAATEGEKRTPKSREELKQEREKRIEERQKKHKKAKKAASKAAKGEITETLNIDLPMPGAIEEITETLAFKLPEILSIEIDESEAHNIVSLSPEKVTAAALGIACKLVELKARTQSPQDDRVVGSTDMIKAALSVPGFNESVPAAKEVLKKWLFKLQLSYIRFTWGWKIAYRFKTKDKIEDVYVDETLKEELAKMMLTVEMEKTPAAPDDLQETFGHRLTRANSSGLNRKLDFNYFNTPLPLCPGIGVPEDKFWDPLDESELWHGQILPGTPIVIDSGSRWIKIGEAGNEIPRYVIPSMVTNRNAKGEYMAGFDALRKATDPRRWTLQPVFDPMEPDWDSALTMWEYIFTTLLQVDPSKHPIMMTETPDMSVNGREETLEIMFEYFNVPSLYIGNTALMSLYAIGELNGLVVDIGNRMQIIPVNAGVIEQHAAVQLKKGVTHINKYLADLLEEKGHYFPTAREREEVRTIKEKCCYIPLNYERELAKPESEIVTSYTRESGEIIRIGQERFKCPELLFNPAKLGILDANFALPQIIAETVMKCDIDTRVNLLSNIMLVGGGTLIRGMGERIEEDVYNCLITEHNMRAARRSNVRCISAPNRKYLPFKGASIFSTTEGWEERCISSTDYFELGKEYWAEKTMYS